MTTARIKSGDTSVVFTDTLLINDVAINLTGATVKFLLKDSAVSFSATATIVLASAGTVSYTVGAGFPTTEGQYNQEWEVTQSDATILTFPNAGYNRLVIFDDLN